MEGDKEQPCQNTLMWSHYADSRNSFRVVYKLSPDMRFNKDHASYLTHRGMNFRSKSIDLTEEDEDHYSIQLDQESYVYAIIFGMKCSDSTKSIIPSILKNKRVRYYEMQEDPQNVYCLKLHEISNSEKGLIE